MNISFPHEGRWHQQNRVFLLQEVESSQGRLDRFQPLAVEPFQMRQSQIEDGHLVG